MPEKKKHDINWFFACGKPWYQKWWVWLIALAIILAVPFAINESYKAGTGYQTLWGAKDVLSFYGSFLAFLGTVALGALALWQNKKASQTNELIMEMTRRDKLAYFYPDGELSITRDCDAVIQLVNRGNSFGFVEEYSVTINENTYPSLVRCCQYMIDKEENRHFEIKIPGNYFDKELLVITFVFTWKNPFGFGYYQDLNLTYKKNKEPLMNANPFLLDKKSSLLREFKEEQKSD